MQSLDIIKLAVLLADSLIESPHPTLSIKRGLNLMTLAGDNGNEKISSYLTAITKYFPDAPI
jgi:hypothetical protein